MAGIRVTRLIEDRRGRALLDDPAAIHYRDPVAQVLDHTHVMTDEDDTKPDAVAQIEQQVEDLHLNRDIKR